MKVSFITTVYNEESTVKQLLASVFYQSRLPDEVIIVDGGSKDNTIKEISQFQFPDVKIGLRIKLIIKKGNRSVGRNEAIKKSSGDIIVCSDAGCILEKDWIKNITEPFANPDVDVVAGYYNGNPKSEFEKCLIPYTLIMPDKVDEDNFLPASRSMAFKKSIWKKIGKFPEEFSNNEDYVFANRLKKTNAKIVFKKNALVYWMPRRNLREAFEMFYRFAKGDSESRIFRPKVLLIFLRYFIFLITVLLYFFSKSDVILILIRLMIATYVVWAIAKNFKYVKSPQAIFYFPLLQIISDIAIILGTVAGF